MAPRRTSPSRAVARAVPLPSAGPVSRTVGRLVPSGRVLLACGALVLIGAGLYAGARATAVFDVRAVEVRGASAATGREVRAALAPFAGQSLLALDGDELVGRLEQIPEVAWAGYDRSFPHTLVVYVDEETPAAVVRRGADGWLVAATGRVLRQVARGSGPPLPRVWMPEREPVVLGERIRDPKAGQAIAAVARLPAGFPGRVRDVRVRRAELTFKLRSGLELRLGDSRDLDLKFAIASRILASLSDAATYLDVSVVERPVADESLNSEVELEG